MEIVLQKCTKYLCLLFCKYSNTSVRSLGTFGTILRWPHLLDLISVFRNICCTCPDPESNKTTDYELFQENKEVRSIADATVATIRGFYVKNTPVLSISRGSSNYLAYQKQSEILNRILLSTSIEIAYTIEEPEHLKKAVRVYDCSIYFSLTVWMDFGMQLEPLQLATHINLQITELIKWHW